VLWIWIRNDLLKRSKETSRDKEKENLYFYACITNNPELKLNVKSDRKKILWIHKTDDMRGGKISFSGGGAKVPYIPLP
jgi:hypothetical protein